MFGTNGLEPLALDRLFDAAVDARREPVAIGVHDEVLHVAIRSAGGGIRGIYTCLVV